MYANLNILTKEECDVLLKEVDRIIEGRLKNSKTTVYVWYGMVTNTTRLPTEKTEN